MTKMKIIDISLRLFSDKGYDAVSMDMIANEVGIRKASIYAHYKGKESIFIEVFNMIMRDYSDFLNGLIDLKTANIIDEFSRIFLGYVNYCRKDKIKMKFWERSYLFPPDFMKNAVNDVTLKIELEFIKRLASLFDRGKNENIFIKKKSIDVITAFYSMMTGYAMAAYFYDKLNIKKDVKNSMEIFFEGILNKG